jgi:hypothetical protein
MVIAVSAGRALLVGMHEWRRKELGSIPIDLFIAVILLSFCLW